MATKKITELTNVTSVQDTDLLIVETSEGTRSVKKSDLVSEVKTGSITLTASNWGYDSTNDWYYQNVSISGITVNSKIDLQPYGAALHQLIKDSVSAIYALNIEGTIIVYTIGAKPTTNLTVQYTVTEVG